jgi:hypothetical protein
MLEPVPVEFESPTTFFHEGSEPIPKIGPEMFVMVLVPGGGIEPPRAEARRILSPLRLPVPPSRRLPLKTRVRRSYFTLGVTYWIEAFCSVAVSVAVGLSSTALVSHSDSTAANVWSSDK